MKRFLLFVMCSLAFAFQIEAQETKLVTPVEDKSQSAGTNEARIIIHSNSEALSMTHSMGAETGTKKALGDGTFEYTINYFFPEDYDDDFMKTQLVLRMAGGQETVPLTMYKGKVYVGSFNEAVELQVKKDNDAVYPYERAAKISFMSVLDNLTITCNGKLCFKDGQPVEVSGVNYKTSVNRLEGQKDYVMTFSLNGKESGALSFEIMASGFGSVQIEQPEVKGRTSYMFMVVSNVKIIEKETTYEELLEIAQGYSRDYTSKSQSAYFATAADAYEAVRAHKDCPIEKKDSYQIESNKFKKIRNYTNAIEQADVRWRKVAASEGFESQNVWKYLNFERKRLGMITSEYPEVAYYQTLKNEIEAEYQKHPMSTVAYPVISGTVTKGKGWFMPVEGTRIYALDYEAKSLGDIKNMEPVGVVQNGKYSITLRQKCSYLFFAGEKKSHKIDYKTQTLNIELTTEK